MKYKTALYQNPLNKITISKGIKPQKTLPIPAKSLQMSEYL
jgi:hypothetical protein